MENAILKLPPDQEIMTKRLHIFYMNIIPNASNLHLYTTARKFFIPCGWYNSFYELIAIQIVYCTSHCDLWPIGVLVVVVLCHICFTHCNYLLFTLLDDVLFHLQVAKLSWEAKTANKVKFVYSNDVISKKIIEDLLDTDQLESAFGWNNNVGFNITKYAEAWDDERWQADALFLVRGKSYCPDLRRSCK